MANKLEPTVRAYLQGSNISRRYIRVTDMTEEIKKQYTSLYENLVMDNSYTTEEYTKMLAVAAGALYKLPRIEIIHKERLDDFMKHLYKVPGTNKQVIKKFVRIGERTSDGKTQSGTVPESVGRGTKTKRKATK